MIIRHKKILLILQYIGLDDKIRMKMDRRNMRNGLLIRSMWEIGGVIKKVDLEYNIMVTVTNMRVVGRKINVMDRVLTG